MDVSPFIADPSFQTALKHFESIIVQIDDKKTYEKALRQANKKYDIKNFKVLNMTPVKARKIYPTILEKYRQNIDQKQSWLENQRRLFIWLVICFLFVNQKTIQELSSIDFAFFSSILNHKKQDFLRFQLFALIKKPKKQTKWTQQQERILLKVFNSGKTYKEQEIEWNEVSKEFFQISSQVFYRSPKQCRERWMNHLDPNKVKGMWAPEQDLILLKFVQEKGKKWSQIVKDLDGRKTQHMVKNRYNSLINKKGKDMGRKNEQKILNRLIEQLQINDAKNEEEEFKASSKQANSFVDNRSDRIKSQRNDELPNIFQSDSALSNSGKKRKFFVQRAGSLSMSERGGLLPQLTNPILEEMDSQEEGSRFVFLISTPLSQRGGQIKSPSLFFLEENIKATKEVCNQDFSLSCISNFDKFVPK